jgi:SpoVK/Ycf46/Vps4 family AAA+-type ATPase
MGHFKISSKLKLAELPEGFKINESDYASLSPDGTFVQLEYIEDENQLEPYKVHPGIYSIKKTSRGLKLETTSFVSDKILETFVNTQNITDKIDCFFNKLDLYPQMGIDIPKRGMLLYGPPGSGKSTAINVVANKYVADGKTTVIIWHTDKYESHQIKDFIKSFEYDGTEKLILIVEDIGGVEMEDRRMPSDSSLLSLLDNQEKTFKIPVFILATTNYVNNFQSNLVNRRGRFDDKIKVGCPNSSQRLELLKFFAKEPISIKAEELIQSKKTDDFTPADIREIIVRSKLHDKTIEVVIEELHKEILEYHKGFEDKRMSMGIGSDY